MTAQWSPSTLYEPGALVVPRTQPAAGPVAIPNAGFEDGNTGGWTIPTGAVLSTYRFAGNYALQFNGTAGVVRCEMAAPASVRPGTTINASCMYHQGGADSGHNKGRVVLIWYTAGGVQIGEPSRGNEITSGSGGGGWKRSSLTATAPAGAAKVAIGCEVNRDRSQGSNVDQFAWDLASSVDDGLAYRAVQASVGLSAGTEPVWPGVLGMQVVDNEVTWEAVYATRVTWKAIPLYVSGATEPAWPTDADGMVRDGTVDWRTAARMVEDENCPNSKIVAIAASKVFAGDGDIAPYSATVNPLDWSTPEDAGFLPTGLQNYGSNPVEALALYRGNLVAFNAEAFQLWQVDEDPANMALVDALPIGCTHHHATAPVSNDLFFLSTQGVRSLSITANSTNYQAGDVGMPIDALVQAAIQQAKDNGDPEPMALYYPAMGQYWLMFPRLGHGGGEGGEDEVAAETHVFVYSMTGSVGAWSRYIFPFEVTDWSIGGDNLYLRSGDFIHRVDPSVLGDEISNGGESSEIVPFPGLIQWPWLDFGQPGVTKMLCGFDIVGEGAVSVSFGFDQRNAGMFTPPWTVVPDTVPGQVIPMPLAAPSLAVRLTYDGTETWQWNAFGLYLQDQRPMA
ncbi:MAG: hypothetical protein IAE88_11640 [Rhodobacteraceae bacterium]|nr:hypothetical protein [Paracoccaceae bacterium]